MKIQVCIEWVHIDSFKVLSYLILHTGYKTMRDEILAPGACHPFIIYTKVDPV